MTKQYKLMLIAPQINSRPLLHKIYGQRSTADALVVAFVGDADADLDYWCRAYKWFYSEDGIYFVGVEGDINNINDDLIERTLETIKEQNIPIDGFELLSIMYQSNEPESEEV